MTTIELLALAKQRNYLIRSTKDLIIFEEELRLYGNVYDDLLIDREYELFLARRDNNSLLEAVKNLSDTHIQLENILTGVSRLTSRLPKESNSYKTKRAKQKASIKEQLNSKLCVD
jgi:hypothetical protein